VVLRAALFDLDGTLVLTSIDFGAMKGAILAIVAEAGLDPARFKGRDALSIVRDVSLGLGAAEAPRFLARCEAAMVVCELTALRQAVPAKGVESFLAWLRARGVKVGIVTRNSRVAVERLLAQIPLPHDVLLTRSDVPFPKPDPSHLTAALDRLGVAPGEAIMIGDHVLDIVGGRAAGMRAIAIAHGAFYEDSFASCPPDQVLRSFDELRALLPEL
jgi:phosphoglycolate phosphatase